MCLACVVLTYTLYPAITTKAEIVQENTINEEPTPSVDEFQLSEEDDIRKMIFDCLRRKDDEVSRKKTF